MRAWRHETERSPPRVRSGGGRKAGALGELAPVSRTPGMPWALGCPNGSYPLLEGDWCLIGEGRVETLPVVEDLDPFKDGSSGRGSSRPEVNGRSVRSSSRKETLCYGVVNAVTAAAHGGRDAVGGQFGPVGLGGVSAATVVVLDERPGFGAAALDGHAQGLQGLFGR